MNHVPDNGEQRDDQGNDGSTSNVKNGTESGEDELEEKRTMSISI